MDHFQRIQSAIDYVEEHIREPIQIAALAERAGYSVTHFYRLFSALTKISVKTYIRNRRLSNAALQLVSTDLNIIDIALDYQFSSPETFTRAFAKFYGISPGKYRKDTTEIELFEKVNVSALKNYFGGATMDVKIVERKEFNVVGLEGIVRPGDASIKQLWGKFDKRIPEIKHFVNQEKSYGMSGYIENIEEDDVFIYTACVEVSAIEQIPVGMIAKTIPQGKYAIFSCAVTPEEIKNTYDYIYGEWMPKLGYEPGETDTIEAYSGRQMEIYIPLKVS